MSAKATHAAAQVTRSVAITGCGWVTPFAAGTIEEVMHALPIDASERSPEGAHHLPVSDSILQGRIDGLPDESRREKPVLLAAAALGVALQNAGLDLAQLAAERIGLAIGCALAGQIGMMDFATDVRAQSPRFVSPIRFPQTVGNYPAGALARAFGLRGPSVTLACGTGSGLAALHEAAAWLHDGAADVVVAGGVEVFTEAIAGGLARELADDDLPFADAACLFVIERAESASARGAVAMARIELEAESGMVANSTALEGASAATVGVVAGSRLSVPGVESIETRAGRSLAASGAGAIAAAVAALAAGRATGRHESAFVLCRDPGSPPLALRLRR